MNHKVENRLSKDFWCLNHWVFFGEKNDKFFLIYI